MKILIVSAQFPYPTWSGSTTRTYQIARQLAARNEVTMLSYAWPHERDGVAHLAEQMHVHAVPRPELSPRRKRVLQATTMLSPRPYYCREVYSRDLQRAIDGLCARQRFDVIQLESSLMGAFRFPRGPRLVINEHNVESEVLRRMCEGERSRSRRAFHRVEHLRYRRFELSTWRRADACFVTSERESPMVRAGTPGRIATVVPNCVDLDYFTPAAAAAARPRTVVFNGILTYRPNVDAAHHLIGDIWPRVRARCPDATLTLVGRTDGADTRPLMAPGVEIVGEVADIRPHIAQAAVVVVPIRIGGGTRLKVLEAMAMGKAIVSTTIGSEGLDVRDGEHLLIADEPQAFAERITELFEDPGRSHELGRRGRRLVEAGYSWDLAGERLQALYRGLTGDDRGAERSPAVVAAPR